MVSRKCSSLIELLGMRYRPDRFDYGWRYVETELRKMPST